MRSLILALLLLPVTPAFAVDLVGVEIKSVSVIASSGGCDPSPYNPSIAQGETQTIDLGPCGAVELSLVGHQVLLAGSLSPPDSALLIDVGDISFVAPENGVSPVPIIFSAPPSPPTTQYAIYAQFMRGTVGGYYEGLEGIGADRKTTFVIGGDSVTAQAHLSTTFDAASPTPSVPTPIWELLTVVPPSPPAPQCSDGVDNDSDGAIDLSDKQCKSETDDSESQGGAQ